MKTEDGKHSDLIYIPRLSTRWQRLVLSNAAATTILGRKKINNTAINNINYTN